MHLSAFIPVAAHCSGAKPDSGGQQNIHFHFGKHLYIGPPTNSPPSPALSKQRQIPPAVSIKSSGSLLHGPAECLKVIPTCHGACGLFTVGIFSCLENMCIPKRTSKVRHPVRFVGSSASDGCWAKRAPGSLHAVTHHYLGWLVVKRWCSGRGIKNPRLLPSAPPSPAGYLAFFIDAASGFGLQKRASTSVRLRANSML
jgi:hypothetical protein